jgi:N-hydroxyarylamine O-acetyltransferase
MLSQTAAEIEINFRAFRFFLAARVDWYSLALNVFTIAISMNIKSYLERINYRGSLAHTSEALRELQMAHLLTVPFENLSIHRKEAIVLETEALYGKIVVRRRGGFCYEANGLFAALLRDLGFQVEMLAAEVARADGSFGLNFDHLALLVTINEQRWLADVGFGDSFREPLLLDESGEQLQGRRAYKIVSENAKFFLKQRDKSEDWETQYRFTLQPYEFADFAGMCRYHQTSPQSHFTQKRICTRATEVGRITLSEMRFITTLENGERHEEALKNEDEYAAVLRERFGILLT